MATESDPDAEWDEFYDAREEITPAPSTRSLQSSVIPGFKFGKGDNPSTEPSALAPPSFSAESSICASDLKGGEEEGEEPVSLSPGPVLRIEEELRKLEEARRQAEERRREEDRKLKERLLELEQKKREEEEKNKAADLKRKENERRRKKLLEARRRMHDNTGNSPNADDADTFSWDSSQSASTSESSATAALTARDRRSNPQEANLDPDGQSVSSLPAGGVSYPRPSDDVMSVKSEPGQRHYQVPVCAEVKADRAEMSIDEVEQVPDIVASTRARCTKHQEQTDPVQLTALRDAVVAESEGELLPAAPPRKRKTNPKPGAAIAERVGHEGNGDGASLPDDDNDDAMATTTTAAAAAANLSSMSIGLPEPSPHPSVREMLECSLDITSATSGERHVIHHIDEGRTKGEGAPGQKVEDEEVERQRHLMKGCSVSGAQLTDEEILEQVMIVNLDTGEKIPLSVADEKLPKCINPLSLHIIRITSEFIGQSQADKPGSDDETSERSKQGTGRRQHLHQLDTASVKHKSRRLKKFLGKKVGRTVSRLRSVADEYLHGDEPGSDDEEMTSEMIRTGIKVKASSSHKGPYTFDQVRMVQDLSGEHAGAVWVVKFSHCGRLMATAGQDNVLRIWSLRSAHKYFNDMRQKYARESKVSPSPSQDSLNVNAAGEEKPHARDDAPFLSVPPKKPPRLLRDPPGDDPADPDSDDDDRAPFSRRPFCVYRGHSADVLDVSWSRNYFILSSSMDKTVRLWHVSRAECLCCFQHIDFVTAIAFHPKDDRYFLSGSLDGKLRLWNIPDKKVALWNEVDGATKLITAANFCQNGRFAVVGTYDGRCIFYSTELLKYFTQIHVRSSRGKNAKGSKISGIESLPSENKILITSNDSRIRLYDLRDLSIACKYKGLTNNSSQIKASLSHDNRYIVCASEDHYIYIWKAYHDYAKFSSARRDRNDYWEGIRAHSAVVTAAVFAPNPALLIQEEWRAERKSTSGLSAEAAAAAAAAGSVADPLTQELQRRPSCAHEPGYLGEALVTADFTGSIKVLVNRVKPRSTGGTVSTTLPLAPSH